MTNPQPSPSATYGSALQHLAYLTGMVAKFTALLHGSEARFIRRVADDYRAGEATAQAAYEAFLAAQALNPTGFCARWDDWAPHALEARRIRFTAILHAPDDDGNWRGAYPFVDDSRTPPNGVSVVYVLFDDVNQPCYVGSTDKFRTRLGAHSRDKVFSRWIAHPCADRATAYALEVRLLQEHKPYLNRKASR